MDFSVACRAARGVGERCKACDGGWGWWADGIIETKVAAAGMAAMCGVKRVAVLASWPAARRLNREWRRRWW